MSAPRRSVGRSPSLERVARAALASQNDAGATPWTLDGTKRRFRRDLSRLRVDGVARTLALYDPRKAGRPYELSVRVKLADYSKAAMAAFEARIGADPVVTTAAFVAGPHDYDLRVFVADAAAARAWLRDLDDDPAVRWARAAVVRTIRGDNLAGLQVGRV